MKVKTLQLILKNEDMSGYAESVIENIILRYDDDNDTVDIEEDIYNECDSAIIYYSDAIEYLDDQGIYEFEEAINDWGATSITQFAVYYLLQEVSDVIYSNEEEYAEEDEAEEY